MRSIWSDHLPVDRVDPKAFLFTGADPCWVPAREYKNPKSPDAAPGLCSECGGDDGFPILDAASLPILDERGRPVSVSAIEDGSHRVCARCMRSGRDPRSQPAGGPEICPDPEDHEADGDDEGYVRRGDVSVPKKFGHLLEG